MTKAAIAAGLIVILAARAASDPLPLPQGHIRLTQGEGELKVYDGRIFLLPLGTHILTYETWNELDGEVRRLQDQETRLTAENKSLKKNAASWHPGWKSISTAVLFGLAGGLWIGMKFSN